MKKNIYLSVLAAASIMAAACEPQGFEPKNDGKVTSIAVKEAVYSSAGTPSMQISFKDNEELQLNVVILPRDAKNQKVTFANKRRELMEVTEAGLLKPKTFGTDTLTVSATDGSGVQTRYVVNITDHKVKATAINVTAAGANVELKVGGTPFDLGACVTLSPADTWDKSVTYTSNDESVATVTAAGIITPAGVGKTTVSVKTADGSNLSRDCNVDVLDLVIRKVDHDRSDWTVTTETATGYGHVPDGTTGLPKDMFDDDARTFLSLVKPGKSYGSVPAQAADFMPSFTVDMKSQKKFDFIRWQHREGNNSIFLRVFAVRIAGSNDGSSFTPLLQGEMLWIPNKGGYVGSAAAADAETYRIDIPEASYRYVKITPVGWSDIYDSQHPDHPGAGAKSGSTIQISEFGLGYTVVE
jgi:hypothetical protein